MIHQEHETYCQIFWGNIHWNEYTSAKEIKQVFHYFLRLTAWDFFVFWKYQQYFTRHSDLLYTLMPQIFAGGNFRSFAVFQQNCEISREIYWRQSNVKIISPIILVLKDSLHM